MCGNFGLLLLLPIERPAILTLLRRMLRVTMVRGAQSAGLVTYEKKQHGATGLRCRVVNGKRTDLADLLLEKFSSALSARASARLYQGHTRFATSSICNLGGCHPHQWLPPNLQNAWRFADGIFVAERCNVESYITHNGDLDFFTVHGITYALSDVQRLLSKLLGRPMPSDVDSACVAGLLDLLRTQGLWLASVRYGYLFGALDGAGGLGERIDRLASAAQLSILASVFEAEWESVLRSRDTAATWLSERSRNAGESHASDAHASDLEFGRESECARRLRLIGVHRQQMISCMLRRLSEVDTAESALPLPGLSHRAAALHRLVETAVQAFFHADLLRAGVELMAGAHGSFGLVLSHSLDAERDVVIAARGQT